mgnify:CR=1 FL=1
MKKEIKVEKVEVPVVATLDEKFSTLEEKTIILFINPNNSEQLLVSKDNHLLEFNYSLKSGTLVDHIDKELNKLFSDTEEIKYNEKLICVFDEIYSDTIYRVFLNTSDISKLVIPDTLKFIDIKKLTKTTHPKSKLYLKVFLKIFSDLELIKYFKNLS